ncbi:response regulator [Pseudoalteromonas lipolytica]|jgi:DNA-binding response OmpR family regulator|uniref:Response regulator n=2 Tax=Pseudoalteromonas TaxID=53246 RepID=A0AAD0WCD3_9GAMM|nr:response regulator [Pseudoalteromonas donghaensis]QLJ09429.1 response regulator [Pseudoalteromonas sp. JSTW]QMW15633.1 response regulator [Pseudoalteromonas sp. MT33b]QPL44015.1 response regulator [Pseudoalteromonas sp. A41-2]|tara:strand:+ start:12539 stop:12970 length:432 start_codon:yes stop_codon:yes gene_type:complete
MLKGDYVGIEKDKPIAVPADTSRRVRPEILVVDDEYFNFEMLKATLSNEFSLSYADSGTSCLASAIANPPNAILLDVCMPGLDGYDTCRLLKNTPETENIPVVMVSGLESELEQKAGFDAGCDAYVVKPFSVKTLIEKIKALV